MQVSVVECNADCTYLNGLLYISTYILQQRRAALFQNDRFIKTYHVIYILQHTQGWKKEKEIIKTINCASNSTVVIMSQSQMQFPYRS